MTTTIESISEIEKAISNTTSSLSAYDALVERTTAAEEVVTSLESDLASLRTNAGGLDARTRGNKFTTATSALSLAKSDLQSLQEDLAMQKTLTVATGKAAARALFEVRDLLRLHRVARVSSRLSEEFDWTALPRVNPQAIASVHKSIRAIGDLGVSQLYFQVQHDDSFVIGAIRQLGEVWSELKLLVEAEGVELNISAVVVVPPIAKPRKPTVGNQLGTMMTPAIAA